MRIAVIGHSGSGKSTMARTLGERYGAEVLHLDRVHWLPGWVERDTESEMGMVEDFLDSHDAWVIDGNYANVLFERRMEEADLIVEMLFGVLPCYLGVWRRFFRCRREPRPDMTEGCPERINLEFTKWVFRDGRTARKLERFHRVAERYPEKTVILRSRRAERRFLRSLTVQ